MAREVCWARDTRDLDAHVGSGVITENEGMGNPLHQLLLTVGRVWFSDDDRCVVIANCDIFRAVCLDNGAQGTDDDQSFEKHVDRQEGLIQQEWVEECRSLARPGSVFKFNPAVGQM